MGFEVELGLGFPPGVPSWRLVVESEWQGRQPARPLRVPASALAFEGPVGGDLEVFLDSPGAGLDRRRGTAGSEPERGGDWPLGVMRRRNSTWSAPVKARTAWAICQRSSRQGQWGKRFLRSPSKPSSPAPTRIRRAGRGESASSPAMNLQRRSSDRQPGRRERQGYSRAVVPTGKSALPANRKGNRPCPTGRLSPAWRKTDLKA